MTKPAVYIFRGAPASGKGSLLPAFCELLPKPVALIEQDKFRWGVHLIGRNIPDVNDEEHLFAHQNTLLMFEQYLKNGGYSIVIEGLFTWDDESSSQGSARQLAGLAKKYGYPCKNFVLRATKEELLRRNAVRGYSVPFDEFDQLYSNIYRTIGPNEIVVDSSGQSLDETLLTLKSFIQE